MKEVTVYYDDQKESCRTCAELFAAYEQAECRKISDYSGERIIFEGRERVGFLFESNSERVPSAVCQIMGKLVMNKNGRCFVYVTGGSREMAAVKMAYEKLAERGYRSVNVYSRYFFEKYHQSREKAVEQILSCMEKNDGIAPELEKKKASMTSREMRRALHREFRRYKKYRKHASD